MPAKSNTFFRLGIINAQKGNYPLAIRYNQESLRLGNYQEALVYYNMGYIFMQMGEMEKAKKFVFRALQRKSHFAAAYNLLGTIAISEKKYQQAERFFIKAVDNNVFLQQRFLT